MEIIERICAGIVLYNPDLDRLNENIMSIYDQVDEIIIVDNNSENINMVLNKYVDLVKIQIVKNDKNIGIAKALNQIMKVGEGKGYKWILTLDQDSVCPKNLINEYKKYISFKNVAIISPTIIDRNKIYNCNEEEEQEYKYVDNCITSASLTNCNIWRAVGGYDEKMFIDWVDFEFCKRILLNDYKIIKINNVKLIHEVGKITSHKFFIWNINCMNHSAFRKYYMARNNIYMFKKYPSFKNLILAIRRNIKLILMVLFFEIDKKNKLKYILNGIYAGIKLKVEVYEKI